MLFQLPQLFYRTVPCLSLQHRALQLPSLWPETNKKYKKILIMIIIVSRQGSCTSVIKRHMRRFLSGYDLFCFIKWDTLCSHLWSSPWCATSLSTCRATDSCHLSWHRIRARTDVLQGILMSRRLFPHQALLYLTTFQNIAWIPAYITIDTVLCSMAPRSLPQDHGQYQLLPRSISRAD